MSQTRLINEAAVGSGRTSPPWTCAGTLVKAAERAPHYLHLIAFPCEKCKGPVILGWIGTRENDIAKETETRRIGAACLACGYRPEILTDPLEGRCFRPIEWEWMVEKRSEAIEPDGDLLAAELSQDADRP